MHSSGNLHLNNLGGLSKERQTQPLCRVSRIQRGFTMIELMMTLAVAGIVLSIAAPSMSNTIKNNSQTVTVNDFLADMHLARSEAIARNLRVTVCASNNSTGCSGNWTDGRIVFADVNGDGDVDVEDIILRVSTSLKNIVATSSDFPQFLSYRPNGRMIVNDVDNNTGEITFCDSRGASSASSISVSTSGRPFVTREQADGGSLTC